MTSENVSQVSVTNPPSTVSMTSENIQDSVTLETPFSKCMLRQGNIFTSICHSVHREGAVHDKGRACMVKGGMQSEGDMCGKGEGACVVSMAKWGVGGGGCAWLVIAAEAASAVGSIHPTQTHSY